MLKVIAKALEVNENDTPKTAIMKGVAGVAIVGFALVGAAGTVDDTIKLYRKSRKSKIKESNEEDIKSDESMVRETMEKHGFTEVDEEDYSKLH